MTSDVPQTKKLLFVAYTPLNADFTRCPIMIGSATCSRRLLVEPSPSSIFFSQLPDRGGAGEHDVRYGVGCSIAGCCAQRQGDPALFTLFVLTRARAMAIAPCDSPAGAGAGVRSRAPRRTKSMSIPFLRYQFGRSGAALAELGGRG
jgi:hypothetical protein